MKKKLPFEYYDFLDVFNRAKADKLLLRRSYNYKIEIIDGIKPSQSSSYRILLFKLQKLKEYFNKNLPKRFLILSTITYL